jgi:hypothetical protein
MGRDNCTSVFPLLIGLFNTEIFLLDSKGAEEFLATTPLMGMERAIPPPVREVNGFVFKLTIGLANDEEIVTFDPELELLVLLEEGVTSTVEEDGIIGV